MVWDFAEVNPLADAAGDPSVSLAGITRNLASFRVDVPGHCIQCDAQTQSISEGKVVSTDPPYYDAIPYSDLTHLDPTERAQRLAAGEPLSFGHTLEDQLGGQLDAGFVLTSLFEDRWPESPLGRYLATFVATRAVRPGA